MKRLNVVLMALLIWLFPAFTSEAASKMVTMYRLYNPNSGEHFYTSNEEECANLASVGWNNEGYAWTAPASSEHPVYRLYNQNSGDHHYTMNKDEKNMLVDAGWTYENIGWYSCDEEYEPLYRLYNPNAVAGAHHYTPLAGERDSLVAAGWKDEGTGWYGVDAMHIYRDYVINMKTGVAHNPNCKDVKNIVDENRYDINSTPAELVGLGYRSCGHCKPW